MNYAKTFVMILINSGKLRSIYREYGKSLRKERKKGRKEKRERETERERKREREKEMSVSGESDAIMRHSARN